MRFHCLNVGWWEGEIGGVQAERVRDRSDVSIGEDDASKIHQKFAAQSGCEGVLRKLNI